MLKQSACVRGEESGGIEEVHVGGEGGGGRK